MGLNLKGHRDILLTCFQGADLGPSVRRVHIEIHGHCIHKHQRTLIMVRNYNNHIHADVFK